MPLLLLLLWGLWVRHPEGESKSTTTQEQEGGQQHHPKRSEGGREGGGEGEWGKQHRLKGREAAPPQNEQDHHFTLPFPFPFPFPLPLQRRRKETKAPPKRRKTKGKRARERTPYKGERRRLHHSHKRNDTQSTNARENPQERNFLLTSEKVVRGYQVSESNSVHHSGSAKEPLKSLWRREGREAPLGDAVRPSFLWRGAASPPSPFWVLCCFPASFFGSSEAFSRFSFALVLLSPSLLGMVLFRFSSVSFQLPCYIVLFFSFSSRFVLVFAFPSSFRFVISSVVLFLVSLHELPKELKREGAGNTSDAFTENVALTGPSTFAPWKQSFTSAVVGKMVGLTPRESAGVVMP